MKIWICQRKSSDCYFVSSGKILLQSHKFQASGIMRMENRGLLTPAGPAPGRHSEVSRWYGMGVGLQIISSEHLILAHHVRLFEYPAV